MQPPPPLENYNQAIESFDQVRILCLGDVMLDRFVYGQVSRVSPEAPIPVMKRERESTMLGGAGNVVRNIVSLGAQCSFVSVVGDDATGKSLIKLVGNEERLEPFLIIEPQRISTEKKRFIAGNQQLLRCDEETSDPITEQTEIKILDYVEKEIANHQLVILSDYAKGMLTDRVVARCIELANAHSIPIFIDPKRMDFSAYANATLLSPNLSEVSHHLALHQPANDETIADIGRTLTQTHKLKHLLITRGKDGMSLMNHDGATHIRAHAREVYDVSGAGDTVIATLGVAHAAGLAIQDAAELATMAAAVVVGRLGTATIYRTDLKAALYHQEAIASQSKVVPQDVAVDMIASWRADGHSIGFTNGCFDVLHVGHLQSLRDAKEHCDKLIIGINSDASVKRLKGNDRPINQEMDRAALLASIECVDLVVIFREDTPVELISRYKPDVLMKGADYTKEQVVGHEIVEAYGGRIELLPIKEGYSSTQTIEKAKTG